VSLFLPSIALVDHWRIIVVSFRILGALLRIHT
jgi:hypothetical protein